MEDIFEKLAALRATAGTRMKKMVEERERTQTPTPKEIDFPDAYEHQGDCRCIKCGQERMWRYYQAHG